MNEEILTLLENSMKGFHGSLAPISPSSVLMLIAEVRAGRAKIKALAKKVCKHGILD